ncbi:MAG: hypothetical protein ACYTG0_45545 [Planctomycetota bacterium]|jgi:hypothetical protein
MSGEESTRPPKKPGQAGKSSSNPLLDSLERGPVSDFDRDRDFQDFLDRLTESPPVEKMREEGIRKMSHVADCLLADFSHDLAKARIKGSKEEEQAIGHRIEEIHRARDRWLDYYHSDEFATLVAGCWTKVVDENKEVWRRESEEYVEAALKRIREARQKVEPPSARLEETVRDAAFQGTMNALQQVVPAFMEQVKEDRELSCVSANVQTGLITVDGKSHEVLAHQCRIVEALVNAAGDNVTGPKLSRLRGCKGKKIWQEIKKLEEAVPAIKGEVSQH